MRTVAALGLLLFSGVLVVSGALMGSVAAQQEKDGVPPTASEDAYPETCDGPPGQDPDDLQCHLIAIEGALRDGSWDEARRGAQSLAVSLGAAGTPGPEGGAQMDVCELQAALHERDRARAQREISELREGLGLPEELQPAK